ncbi:hypothetical protein GCM10009624_30900 [Gordonia sinesedis]
MNTVDLVARLRRLGTDLTQVEVKSAAGGLPKDVVESLSAFANGDGGVLLLGLSEADGFTPVPGFDAKAMRDALANACADQMKPPLRPAIEIEEFEGALIVRADIDEIDPMDKPCYVKTRGHHQGSFIRSGDGDRVLSAYEVAQLLANRTQPKHDLEPITDATLDDLSSELVDRLIRRARDRHPRTFRNLETEEALARLNVVTRVDGQSVPTLAGLISLGNYPQQFLPQLFVAVIVSPGTQIGDQSPDGVRFLDNSTADGPIFDMVATVEETLRRNMRKAAVVKGLYREDRYDYPLDVIRELVVNAIMHRDYSPASRGMHVQIELYLDRLVVNSPGGLFGDVSARSLGTAEQRSSSRNAALAKLLADIPVDAHSNESIGENRGSGLPNAMRSLRQAGMSPARFDVSPGHVRVTVPGHALLGVDVTEWISSLSEADLTSTQDLALAMARVTGRVTNAMLQAWGVDRLAAGAALRDLVGRDLLVVTGGKRYASYQLSDRAIAVANSPMSYTRSAHSVDASTEGIAADLDAVEQAIAAGHVTARAIEAALGMNYRAVLRRLTKLIDAGRVQRIGQRHSSRQTYRLTNEDSR